MTDAVLDEVKEWRARALDAVYPVVIFDALRVKIRDQNSRIVRNKTLGELMQATAATASGALVITGQLWVETDYRRDRSGGTMTRSELRSLSSA